MKKFSKFLFSVLTIAAAGAGAYLAYKKFTGNSAEEEDEDESEDDLDEYELNDDPVVKDASKDPEYVSITPNDEA